jgi:hypothetical protein
MVVHRRGSERSLPEQGSSDIRAFDDEQNTLVHDDDIENLNEARHEGYGGEGSPIETDPP